MCRLNTNLLFNCVKLIGYLAVNVVSSNPYVGTSLRIKISFPLLSIGRDEFILTQKIMTFFPTLPSANKNCERESNPMSYLLNLYLLRSAFFISFTDPNKQLLNVKFLSKSLDRRSSV